MSSTQTSRKIISPATKSQILSRLKVPGCTVSELAKAYNISTTTIYSLQQEERKAQEHLPFRENATNFLELAVVDQPAKVDSSLHKASLTFNNCSLTIEGKFQSSTLFEIMKMLEEQSC